MRKKSPTWPEELKRPIITNELVEPPGFFGTDDSNEYQEKVRQEVVDALLARLNIVCEFFQYDGLPDSNARWMNLLIHLCDHWQIPAFQIAEKKARGPGASTKWTDRRVCELFADVQSLVRPGSMTEHTACKYIAAHHRKFGGRYQPPKKIIPGDWGKTLHRQFLRAKHKVKNNYIFCMVHFGEGIGPLRPVPPYGPELFRIAIERYAVARN